MSTTDSVKRRFLGAAFTILFTTIMAAPSMADMLTFQEGVSPSAGYVVPDADIRSGAPDANFEGDIRWNIGNFGQLFREVAKFDISALPAGATITSVSLTVYQNSAGSGGTQTQVDLHTLTNDFNELQVTWNSRTASSLWATPGGDFSVPVLSSITPVGIVDGTAYTFPSSPNFITAANNALTSDGFLRLMVKSAAEAPSSLMSFYAEDDGSPTAFHPALTITFIPEPASLGLIVLSGGLLLWRRRSRE
jgi:hypothetical protein